MRFSIIVPVYNVENYITQCLDSIVNQTFGDFEVVVVDDQTPDNSMQIVQTFADRYPDKFQVIHQQNKGLGGARNTGVAAAKGEYLIFIDSDDYIKIDMLQILDAHIRRSPCDILEFNYLEVSPSGRVLRRQSLCDEVSVYTQVEDKAKLMLGPPIACNKVFRREFFIGSGVLFPEKTRYEDAVTRILTAKAESVVCCTEHLYHYVQREGSIMNSEISPRVLDIAKVVDLVYDAFVRDDLLTGYGNALEASMIMSLMRIIDDVYRQSPNHPLQQQLVAYTVGKFPAYTENVYLTSDAKKKLGCLERGDVAGYKQCCRIMKMKSAILQVYLFRWLNKLRKSICK